MNYWLLMIPLLTILSGLIIVHIIRILVFKPFEPVKIAGLTIQGLLPRYQQEIAIRLGQFAAKEFSSLASLEQKLNDPGTFESIRPLVEAHMDDFLRNKLKEQMPMIGMFIGDKTIQSLKTIFIREIEELFPHVMQQFAGSVQKNLDIEQAVVAKINTLSPRELETVFSKSLQSSFQKVYALTLLIGLLIGIIQLLLLISLS